MSLPTISELESDPHCFVRVLSLSPDVDVEDVWTFRNYYYVQIRAGPGPCSNEISAPASSLRERDLSIRLRTGRREPERFLSIRPGDPRAIPGPDNASAKKRLNFVYTKI